MIVAPVRERQLIYNSATHTAEPQGFRRYVRKHVSGPFDVSGGQMARLCVQRAQTKLQALSALPRNWDGGGSPPPQPGAIANASARLPELYRASSPLAGWRDPHVSANESGEVSFEWWCGPKKITMYFAPDAVEIIRVWGEDIEDEMEHRRVGSELREFAEAWAWLYGN
jgi:hypothetical protein